MIPEGFLELRVEKEKLGQYLTRSSWGNKSSVKNKINSNK